MVDFKLKIANVIIKMQSRFSHEVFTDAEHRLRLTGRFDNFSYAGELDADIQIKVNLADRLPRLKGCRTLFVTRHFQDGSENWRLLKKGDNYIYKSLLSGKKQLMQINKSFDRVAAYLLPKNDKGWVWDKVDIIYDFLQVLLINYFALKKRGIFVHSVGIKDLDGQGLLFIGRSGTGKSTNARIWHRHSMAKVINDDRIVVDKLNGKFFIHGCPWHGDFSDYLLSKIESAPLKKIFFIHHSPENTAKRITEKEAFQLLYPAIFPTFWDKECLENIISFGQDLVKNIPCFSLGFMKNKKVIGFVRKI